MAADRDSARFAGPLLAAGRVQDALRVVSWDVDPGRRGVCPCGRTFILNGFKTRWHICRDQCGHVDVLVGFETPSTWSCVLMEPVPMTPQLGLHSLCLKPSTWATADLRFVVANLGPDGTRTESSTRGRTPR